MADLRTNYKDDILDTSQNTKRKYDLIENQDGTYSLDDETVYTQEGDSFGASDINATNTAVNTLNHDLSGFKFYPTGTQIVGLIADDSAYTDEDGNYVVWGTETANQLVEDNPNTYKAIASTEDTRGSVEEDTAKGFGGTEQMIKETIVLTPVFNSTQSCTDILITTHGMGMLTYRQVTGYYTAQPTVTDYFEIRPKANVKDIPIVLKKGKWIDGEGVVYDTSNGDVNVNMVLTNDLRPQRQYGVFVLVDK